MSGTARQLSASVTIVGAGPVGLTVAMELASQGIDVAVLETRRYGEPPSVKCNHVAARTMEVFRRLGLADRVRNSGLPPDYPHDIAYRVTTTGTELTRIPIPCRRDRFTATGGPDTDWPTPEPPHRINQIFLEPLMLEHAAAMGKVRLCCHTTVSEVRQDADRVIATALDLDTGETVMVESEYLVGCEGGRSLTRHVIGAKFEGDPVVQRVQSTYIRAPGLIDLLTERPAWGTFSLNPRRCGNVYAIDGHTTWLIHNYLNDSEPDFESVDRDRSIRHILGVDEDFTYEVLSKEDWFGRRLVADSFRDRRLFICGDAAHIWVPFAGYGMNAGIADAVNLAWLLAARLHGWGAPPMLDAYEAERHPITEQVSHFAMNHALQVSRQRTAVPVEIEAPGTDGDTVRERVGRSAYDLNVQQYAAAGLNFGYFYDASPIISYDDERAPGYTMGAFEPSTVPGCRLPHLWLDDGRSLYDALGPAYTLVRFEKDLSTESLVDAAAARGVPLAELDPQVSGWRNTYRQPLMITRRDLHIAWRGDETPSDVDGLLDLLTGRALTSPR